MNEVLLSYYTATAAVIGSMLIQVALLIWGEATVVTFTIGQTMLFGCLAWLRYDYKKNYKKRLDEFYNTEL